MNGTNTSRLIRDIAAEGSRTGKEELLKRGADDAFFMKVLRYAYDPFKTFGLTPPKVETEGRKVIDGEVGRHIFTMLDCMAARTITGNEARELFKDWMFQLDVENADLLFKIVSKDMRCGITAKTINKVFPGLIPVFEVMLASPSENAEIALPVIAEPKLDGVRVIAIVNGKSVQFLSRSGNEFPAMNHMAPAVLKMLEDALQSTKSLSDGKAALGIQAYLDSAYVGVAERLPPNAIVSVMLDGEMVSGSFNKSVSEVRRKDEQALDAVYRVFDIVPLNLFRTQKKIEVPYSLRRKHLEYVTQFAPENIKIVPRYIVSTEDEIKALYEAVRKDGLEGLILKDPIGVYEKKRSKGWVKMKAEETIDAPVIGAFEGEGKYAGSLGGLIVDVEGVQVRVGGGFTDSQRASFWLHYKQDLDHKGANVIVGRLIEIEYQEKTPDGSLRHPRFVRFRDDKAEAAE